MPAEIPANGDNPPPLRLIHEPAAARPPALDTAASEALMRQVAAGDAPATLRLRVPGRVLAFSKQDANSDGFPRALEAARAAGFEPVIRLAGGRAALYHEGTLALAWSTPAERPAENTRGRFEYFAELIAAALRRLGVDARVGEVPGEYCPGAFSVNAEGRLKLAGIGQRMIRGAAHLGAVLVATDSRLVRETLIPVYRELGLDWDPATAGAVEDVVPGAGSDEVVAALRAELEERYAVTEAEMPPSTLELAAELEAKHAPALA